MAKIKQKLNGSANSKSMQAELAHLRTKVSELSSLIEISIIINSVLELDELIHLVMQKAQSVMQAEASSVMLINEETNVLECEVALGEVGEKIKKMQLKVGEGVAGWVALHGKPQIIPDVSKDPRFSAKTDSETGFQTRSILAAPLNVRDRTIGVAEVINHIDGKSFDDDDLELFSTFCRQVAMAIENARMHKVKLEKQRLEQQLESAKIIQESFMPDLTAQVPNPRFSIAAKSLPATSVGGDLFDFIQLNDHLIGIAVGDVTGKGVPAALFMARMISDFRRHTQISKDPSQVLKAVNKLLFDRSRRGMFVTFQYGILDIETGEFSFANAGHSPFFRIESKKRTIDLLDDSKDVPLGVLPTLTIEQSTIKLNPGDTIVLITDGIIESKNEKNEAYSMDRISEFLSHSQKSVDDIIDGVIADVQKFSQNTPQHDDLTILAVRWN